MNPDKGGSGSRPSKQGNFGQVPFVTVSKKVCRVGAQAHPEKVVVPRRYDRIRACRGKFTRGKSLPDFPSQSHNLVGFAEVPATHVLQHVLAEGQPVELLALFSQQAVQRSLVVDRTRAPGRNLTKLTLFVFHVTLQWPESGPLLGEGRHDGIRTRNPPI